jgi:thiol-disulfide isomerase/thioredoxin
VIIVLVATLGGSGKAAASVGKGYTPTAAPPSIVNGLANVSTGDLNEAGNGGDQVIFNSTSGPVYTVHGQKPLTSGGKPLVLYFGAEYCPFCAATRWPLVIALDKFGSFTGLQVTKSSPVDFSPNTPTLDFAKATYHSNYLSFSETEQLSNSCKHAVPNPSPPPKYACASLSDYPTVQNPSSFVKSIVTKYDSSPFVGQSAAGGIPFIDIGNRWVESGAPYPSSASQFPPISIDGLSWQQVVNTLQAPIAGSPGQAILGAANHYIAAFCELLGGKGPAICHASFVTAAEKTLS